MIRRSLALLLCALLAPGCFLERTPLPSDSGVQSRDGGLDAASGDAGPDSGDAAPDSGPADSGALDSGPVDSGPSDSGPPDSGPPDSGPPDAGVDACVPTSPPDEICDGIDNDCDPSTIDGVDDPRRGEDCDDPIDVDLCAGGKLACVAGGALVCAGDDGDTSDEVELCNDEDDDCNPDTPDGAAEPTLNMPCDGEDDDSCEEGVFVCTDRGMRCSDMTDSQVETCNGADEDCDGAIDEGACPCERGQNGTRVYLFCDDAREWADARDFCADQTGYALVEIDDETEQRWVRDEAAMHSSSGWWIGANDLDEEDAWEWVDGSAVSYDNWNAGEPNNSGASTINAGEDCVELIPGATGESGVPGGWNDADCTGFNQEERRFICEGGS